MPEITTTASIATTTTTTKATPAIKKKKKKTTKSATSVERGRSESGTEETECSIDTNRMLRSNSRGSDSGSGDEVCPVPSLLSTAAATASSSNMQLLKRQISRVRTTSTSDKDGTIHMKGAKTIYTAGRPPWYDSSGQMKEALVVGLCGGSASGKTTVSKRIIEELNVPW